MSFNIIYQFVSNVSIVIHDQYIYVYIMCSNQQSRKGLDRNQKYGTKYLHVLCTYILYL